MVKKAPKKSSTSAKKKVAAPKRSAESGKKHSSAKAKPIRAASPRSLEVIAAKPKQELAHPFAVLLSDGKVRVAEWYELGARAAACRVGRTKLDKNGGGEATITVYPAGQLSQEFRLRIENHKLVGPRDMVFNLREPTATENLSIDRVFQKEQQMREDLDKIQAIRSAKRSENPNTEVQKERLRGVAKAKNASRAQQETRQTIVRLKKEPPYKGKRLLMFQCIKNGMSVAEYVKALAAGGFRVERWTLDQDKKNGLIKIEEASGG
jgi:hypothetical protein